MLDEWQLRQQLSGGNMAKRFAEVVQPGIQVAPTGASEGLMSLADRLEAFQSFGSRITGIAAQTAQEQAVKRGVQSAQQVVLEKESGITKAPKMKEERFFGGIEAAAHNKALRSAYLASLDNDNRESINAIFIENSDSVIEFNEQANAYKKGVLKGVDPFLRREVAIDLDRKISLSRSKVLENQTERQEKNLK